MGMAGEAADVEPVSAASTSSAPSTAPTKYG